MLPFFAIALLAAAAGSETSQPAEQSQQNADPQEKVICKRFMETGSLVRAQRVCKTKREWDRERAVIRSAPAGGSCNATGTGPGC